MDLGAALAELLHRATAVDPAVEWAVLFGVIAAVLTVVSNLMKRMVPLRVFALAATACFGVNALLERQWINVVLYVVLFAINAYRLYDLRRLLRELERARTDTPLSDWLLPYMKKKRFKAGHELFTKGAPAHQIVYIATGSVYADELGQRFGPGSLVGEIGLFTAERKRTATLVCETDCECYTMTDEAIYLLYFQNPKLGFYLVRLIVQRLLADLQRRPTLATDLASG